MLRVIFLYKAVNYLALQLGQSAVFYNDELLVCRGFQCKAVSLCFETVPQLDGEFNRRGADLLIQPIGEQGVELQRVQTAFAIIAPRRLTIVTNWRGIFPCVNTTASPQSAPHLVPPM